MELNAVTEPSTMALFMKTKTDFGGNTWKEEMAWKTLKVGWQMKSKFIKKD